MPYCKICGRKSREESVCSNCRYFLDNGADELTIRKMLSDDKVKKIWKDNGKYSEELAREYYDSLIENYDVTDDSKENFGFNTFTDGIRLGLDIVMPLISVDDRAKAIEKIKTMIKRSKERR